MHIKTVVYPNRHRRARKHQTKGDEAEVRRRCKRMFHLNFFMSRSLLLFIVIAMSFLTVASINTNGLSDDLKKKHAL